ncbi:MAG: PAS domain S-box protein [Deltaproteobacteria bacterium]|nr:PAS domain S-box protein [Deltaproteobacteria bacterium]MCB9786834.1 PAS domain S-box protein [Deltaproteobacteria bacterium]
MEPEARELFFDGAPYAALLLDAWGAVVAANAQTHELLAPLEPSRLRGRPLGELFDGEGQAVWSLALHEMGPDGRVPPTMMRLVVDGSVDLKVMVTARAWPDAEQRRTAVTVALLDVRERLRFEDDALLIADRYRSIMQTARDAILTLDREGLVTLANPAAQEMFGAPGNSLMGRAVEDLVGPAARSAIRLALAEAARVEGSGAKRLAVPCVRLNDGRSFPGDISLSGFQSSTGSGFTAIVRDETERDELQRALQEKAALLERKNEELEAFSYSVSHALKAPLRTMGSFAGLLAARYKDKLDDAGKRYLSFLVDCCAEQSRQIEQLLEMSHLSRSEDAFESVAVGEIVQKLLDFHVSNAGGRAFDVQVQGDLPAIVAQRVAIHHLFDNLIGNAVKFTAREPVARIVVGYAAEGDDHHFWVGDNGIGIAAEDEGTIFRLFGRLHRQEEFEGTGAGLNIVLKILERHGGRIRLDSMPGEGATFHVFLPRSRQDASDVRAAKARVDGPEQTS